MTETLRIDLVLALMAFTPPLLAFTNALITRRYGEGPSLYVLFPSAFVVLLVATNGDHLLARGWIDAELAATLSAASPGPAITSLAATLAGWAATSLSRRPALFLPVSAVVALLATFLLGVGPVPRDGYARFHTTALVPAPADLSAGTVMRHPFTRRTCGTGEGAAAVDCRIALGLHVLCLRHDEGRFTFGSTAFMPSDSDPTSPGTQHFAARESEDGTYRVSVGDDGRSRTVAEFSVTTTSSPPHLPPRPERSHAVEVSAEWSVDADGIRHPLLRRVLSDLDAGGRIIPDDGGEPLKFGEIRRLLGTACIRDGDRRRQG